MIEIKQSNHDKKGVFEVYYNEKKAGLMTYVWTGEEKFIIDHTEVDEQYNGLGFGKKMVEAAIDFAREKGVKIIPLCPFAKKVFEKTIDFQDVLA